MHRLLSGLLLCSLLSTPCLSSRIDNFLRKESFKAKDFRAAIRREPNIFQVDQNRDNFLHKAVRHNNAKAIRLFAENSTLMLALYKTNAQHLSPMELCVTLGHIEAFEALLDKMHVAQFRISNRWGWELVHLLARHDRAEMIRILAKRGLNINARDETGDRWTALDVAYFYNANEAAAALRELGVRAVAYQNELPVGGAALTGVLILTHQVYSK